MTMTPTPTIPECSRAERATPAREASLSIPKHLWSAPVAEARRCGRASQLSRLILLFPVVALVSDYIAAAAAAHGHAHAGGWLLALAVTAILAGGVVLGVHAHRIARYRAEASR